MFITIIPLIGRAKFGELGCITATPYN